MKHQINQDITSNLCGFLRKPKLYHLLVAKLGLLSPQYRAAWRAPERTSNGWKFTQHYSLTVCYIFSSSLYMKHIKTTFFKVLNYILLSSSLKICLYDNKEIVIGQNLFKMHHCAREQRAWESSFGNFCHLNYLGTSMYLLYDAFDGKIHRWFKYRTIYF